jgi:Flp pilus assembly pilin Flp
MRTLALLRRAAKRFLREDSGMTAVEYAVLAGFVLLVCLAAVAAFTDPAGSAFQSSSTSIGTYADP